MSLTAAIRIVFPVGTGRCRVSELASTTVSFGPFRRTRPQSSPRFALRAGLMAYQSTLNAPDRDTNAFYRRTLHVLSDARVPFLVGGSHALLNYTGIVRETKDFDLFLKADDLDAGLDALKEAGY